MTKTADQIVKAPVLSIRVLEYCIIYHALMSNVEALRWGVMSYCWPLGALFQPGWTGFCYSNKQHRYCNDNKCLFPGHSTCPLPVTYGLCSIYHCPHSGTQANGTWFLCGTLPLTIAYELSQCSSSIVIHRSSTHSSGQKKPDFKEAKKQRTGSATLSCIGKAWARTFDKWYKEYYSHYSLEVSAHPNFQGVPRVW